MTFCSHCGRTVDVCKRFGSPSCEESRKRFFEEQEARIKYFSEQWKKRRNAASNGPISQFNQGEQK